MWSDYNQIYQTTFGSGQTQILTQFNASVNALRFQVLIGPRTNYEMHDAKHAWVDLPSAFLHSVLITVWSVNVFQFWSYPQFSSNICLCFQNPKVALLEVLNWCGEITVTRISYWRSNRMALISSFCKWLWSSHIQIWAMFLLARNMIQNLPF